MARTRALFSTRQAGTAVAVDVLAQSPQARTYQLQMDANTPAVVVQNTSKYATLAPAGNASSTAGFRIQGAQLSFQVAPVSAAGTATIQIDSVAADGVTTTNLVAATSVLLMTALVSKALTLTTTGAAKNGWINPVGSTILITVTTSNNAVGTADVGFGLTLAIENVEDTTINDKNTTI